MAESGKFTRMPLGVTLITPDMAEASAQARAYMNSKENILLVPNRDFGNRKLINLPMNRQLSFGKNKNPGELMLVKYTRWCMCSLVGDLNMSLQLISY